jgi:hypothetical protein
LGGQATAEGKAMSKRIRKVSFESTLVAALATVTVATFGALFHAVHNLQVVI